VLFKFSKKPGKSEIIKKIYTFGINTNITTIEILLLNVITYF